MKKFIIGALVALFSFVGASAYDLVPPTKTLLLYPKGQNVDCGIVEKGVHVTLGPGESNGRTEAQSIEANGNIKNISDSASICIYLPKKGNGQMVVVCPGGGYWIVSSYNEGSRVADWFVRRGIAVCVVLYRLPYGHENVPLTDVQNAFRYCRYHAKEWGINSIGVMGFSAGGHLAACASNLWTDDVTRPDFSILVYPVITMMEATHGGSRKNLIGDHSEKYPYWSMENQVSVHTPPTLLLLCRDDKTVPPVNSINYYKRMLECGVTGELHIFDKGGHGWGFSTIENNNGVDHLGDSRQDFFDIISRWLETL